MKLYTFCYKSINLIFLVGRRCRGSVGCCRGSSRRPDLPLQSHPRLDRAQTTFPSQWRFAASLCRWWRHSASICRQWRHALRLWRHDPSSLRQPWEATWAGRNCSGKMVGTFYYCILKIYWTFRYHSLTCTHLTLIFSIYRQFSIRSLDNLGLIIQNNKTVEHITHLFQTFKHQRVKKISFFCQNSKKIYSSDKTAKI